MFPCLVEIECQQKFNWETANQKAEKGERGRGKGKKMLCRFGALTKSGKSGTE